MLRCMWQNKKIYCNLIKRNINTRITQRYSESRSQSFIIQKDKDDKLMKVEDKNIDTSKKISNNITDLIAYFLPKGYPYSVGNGYDKYIQLQAISMLFSTTGGVLSMQSMLYAIGAGSGSVPLAATLNWIIKDGLGQLGGVIFASVVSNRFDADPKRWRMVASASMDASSFLELLTPIFPHLFLPIASVANVGKNISFLAASASRAAAHRSFATHENLADITAKAGSQSILCSMLGTGLGITVASGIGSYDASLTYPLTVVAFMICSSVNLTATYYSLRHVTLATLNPDRLDYIFTSYLNSGSSCNKDNNNSSTSSSRKLMLPSELRDEETMLGAPEVPNLPKLEIGSDIDECIHNIQELYDLCDIYDNEEYILNVTDSSGSSGKSMLDRVKVHVIFKTDASERDVLKGLLEAMIVRRKLSDGHNMPDVLSSTRQKDSQDIIQAFMKDIYNDCNDSSYGTNNDDYDDFKNGYPTDDKDDFEGKNYDLNNSNISSISKSSTKNSYPTWLVETLMLETRFARLDLRDMKGKRRNPEQSGGTE